MAFCLNPDCPHKKKTGHPAEFREGITHCSDCGSLLSEEVIENNDNIQKTPPRRIIHTNLYKRILYTLGFVFLYRVLLFIPVPGIDLQVLSQVFSDEQFNLLVRFFGSEPSLERFSILALGIMPYVSVYILVEILSLFIPPLKSWRGEGYAGRIRIKEITLFATFLIALVQSYGVAVELENMTGPAGGKIVLNPGVSFRLLVCVTMIAGTYLTIWIAELITKKGIGHGISILILAGFTRGFFSYIPKIYSLYQAGSLSLGSSLLYFPMIIIIVTVIVFMERSKRKIPVRFNDGTEAYIPLKLTSAGTTPAEWTSMLIMLLTTVFAFAKTTHFQWLMEALTRAGFWYFITNSIVIIFLYYLFTSFFYDPKRMSTLLKDRRATIVSPTGEEDEHYIDKSLESMIPVGALYLIFIVFIPQITYRFLPFLLGGTVLITAVAIILDLIEEVHMRGQGGNFVRVAELHDVPMAGFVKNLLEEKGLPCYLRGYYHRALLYFFGPYIDISVLVPEEKIADAREVIENYFEAKILTVQSGRVSVI
jgi:preprotein translocase subunit SecY